MDYGCALMTPGIYEEMDFSALTTRYNPIVGQKSRWGTDYASYIFSRLPTAVKAAVEKAYDGTFESVADDINRALDSMNRGSRIAALEWFYKASQRKQEVCWVGDAKEHYDHYINAYAALADYLLEPESVKSGWIAKRFNSLPPGFPRTDKAHCVHPGTDEFHVVAHWIREWKENVSSRGTSNGPMRFREYAEHAGTVMMRAVYHAAQGRYICSSQSGCAEEPTRNKLFQPRMFGHYLTVLRDFVAVQKAFCILFEDVEGEPGLYWIDGEGRWLRK